MDSSGGDMTEEKTLLQQIRDKEQEFGKKIETVKQETDAQISAVRWRGNGPCSRLSEQEKKLLKNYIQEKNKRPSLKLLR